MTIPTARAVEQVYDIETHSACSSEDSVCAICFERRPFVNLPCSCKVNYCASCWDRALAVSVTTRGKAQCPSCRSGFHVDFNQDAACLVFSKAEKGMTIADWRSRLYDKARPVQIKLLKDFGTAVKDNIPTAQKVDAPKLETGPKEEMESSLSVPVCICGGILEKVSSRTRIVRMLEDTEPGWRSRVTDVELRIDKLAASSLITCDLCDDVATRTGFVWTCKNGPNTVLHPAAYDVCESCFSRYAGCSNVPNQIQAARSQKTCQSSSRCIQGCTPFTMSALQGQRRADQGLSAGVARSPSPASDPASRRGNEGSHANARHRTSSLQARLRRTMVSRILGLS